MPLLKRKPFPIVDPPKDLNPNEGLWQIRFTNEIFRNYEDYLERMNLFRKRIWTCGTTGKTHLTYEEALVSEIEAREKILQFPQQFRGYVLRTVQFSTLKMDELVSEIVDKLRDTFVQGEELTGKLENSGRRCRIVKELIADGHTCYEVGWLNENGEVTNTTTEDKDNLIRQKFPFSKGLLKLFIKDSTVQNNPWVLHSKLAKEFKISTVPPKELRDRIANDQAQTDKRKRRMNLEDDSNNRKIVKKTKSDLQHCQTTKSTLEEKQYEEVKIKYPIEDLLVRPSSDDPVFTVRPVPSTEFAVPIGNVGDLLMVWDFSSTFGNLLRLSPFSIDDFERAITYKGDSDLVAELHASILALLVKDHGEYYCLIQQKKRKEMVTTKTWMQYLSHFLELDSIIKLKDHAVKINSGNYSRLGVDIKLAILSEMLRHANLTEAIRENIDYSIEKGQSLMASKKEEDQEELRKRREEKRLKEVKSDDQRNNEPCDSKTPQTDMSGVDDVTVLLSIENKHPGNRGSKLDALASRRALLKKSSEMKIAAERAKETSRMQELQRQREENKARQKEAKEKKLKQQRLEIYEREMEKLHIRTNPLGKDRDHNRYWFFQRDGRIFVESADHNSWGYYSTKEELDALIGSLNPKGQRELELQKHLQKRYTKICSAFYKRSKEMARKDVQENMSILRRSVRVSAHPEDESNAPSFLRYVNKLKR